MKKPLNFNLPKSLFDPPEAGRQEGLELDYEKF